MLAAMHGKIACVQKLLEAGANVCKNPMNVVVFLLSICWNVM